MSSNPRSKGWFLTSNDSHQTHFDTLKSMNYRYLCIGAKELAPTTGHEHYHILLYFDNARTFSSIQKQLRTCNIQPLKSFSASKEYLSKEGTPIFEDGEPPHQGAKVFDPVKLKASTNDEIIAEYGPRSVNMIKCKEILKRKITPSTWHKEIQVIYIYGPSEAGKSKFANDYVNEHFGEVLMDIISKKSSNFYAGVTGDAKVAIYDEFRDFHMPVSEFIELIDYNKHYLNVKGDSILNEYTTIIITSIQDPKEIYSSVTGEPRKQWLRRMKIIHLVPQYETIDEDYIDEVEITVSKK